MWLRNIVDHVSIPWAWRVVCLFQELKRLCVCFMSLKGCVSVLRSILGHVSVSGA